MRRISVLLVVVGLVASLAAPSAVAASSRPVEYLALGDSMAFGWNPYLDRSDATNFKGYTDMVAAALRDGLTNASCPGETSSHFIDLAGSDNDCGAFRTVFPLHVDYHTSQLAYADHFLQTHPKTQLVTIDIGVNDLHVLVNSCGSEANVPCILAGLPTMLATLSSNLDTIYGHIRNLDGYHHKLVALTVPARDYITDPLTTGVVQQINAVVANRTLAWGGIVADGFGAEYAASLAYGGDTCAAGLRIVNLPPKTGCDDHPSPAGHALLAQTLVSALRPD